MIKVLIVDDSKFMRINLTKILSEDEKIHVIGSARNGIEALNFIDKNPVDIVILDFFMPKMDGLETLEKIMENKRIPTIMITIANKSENADFYFKALNLGAFDIIEKPSGMESLYLEKMKERLIKTIHFAFVSKGKYKVFENQKLVEKIINEKKGIGTKFNDNFFEIQENIDSEIDQIHPSFFLLIIGSSTGGPPRLVEIVKKLPKSSKYATIIIQHMPEGFTASFANRLDANSDIPFTELKNGEVLRPGRGYVAPGDFHVKLLVHNDEIIFLLNKEHKIWGLRPSIDYFMINSAPIFKNKCIGIILTGMGKDGAFGLSKVKDFGGIIIVQDPNEAIINSMPLEAIKRCSVDKILPIRGISTFINNIFIK